MAARTAGSARRRSERDLRTPEPEIAVARLREREDAARRAVAGGPRAMRELRELGLGCLRSGGWDDIAQAIPAIATHVFPRSMLAKLRRWVVGLNSRACGS